MLTILILLFCIVMQSARSQFVDLQIEVLPSSEIKTFGNAGEIKHDHSLIWLGISVDENIEVIVGITYRQLPEGERPEPALYLNDGTADIARAMPFPGNKAVLAINNGSIQEQPLNKQPVNYTAIIEPAFIQSNKLALREKSYEKNSTSNLAGSPGQPLPTERREGRQLRQASSSPENLTLWIGLRPEQTRELTIEYN